MPGYFEDVCLCMPPSTFGMRQPEGWLTRICPTCRQRWDLEHYHAEDRLYLGCSWILNGQRRPDNWTASAPS